MDGEELTQEVTPPSADLSVYPNPGTGIYQITFTEAALGDEVDIPLLDGARTTLRLPPGTQNGSRQRVKGKGVETAKGTGDLIVTFEVAVPTKLSGAQRKALESLASATKESPRAHLEVV